MHTFDQGGAGRAHHLSRRLHEKTVNFKISGNEVYYTA